LRTSGADVFRHAVDLAANFFDAQALPVGAGDGIVQVGDVRLMVLGVMNVHRARIDVGFKRILRIGQSG
jgi:hypothetical protein